MTRSELTEESDVMQRGTLTDVFLEGIVSKLPIEIIALLEKTEAFYIAIRVEICTRPARRGAETGYCSVVPTRLKTSTHKKRHIESTPVVNLIRTNVEGDL